MTDIVREMIESRRTLHRHPEEGWCEFQTTALILERLRALGYEPLCGTRVIDPKAVMGRSTKKVEAGLRTSSRFRSSGNSRKSSAGEGKPARTAPPATGISRCVVVSGR